MEQITDQMMNVAVVTYAFEMLERGMTATQAKGLRVLQITEGINNIADKVYVRSLEKVIEILERPIFV